MVESDMPILCCAPSWMTTGGWAISGLSHRTLVLIAYASNGPPNEPDGLQYITVRHGVIAPGTQWSRHHVFGWGRLLLRAR